MQYTISMTSRMLAISALCAFLLCVLLFLLGIELGKRFAEPQVPVAAVPALPAAPSAPTVAAPAVPAAPALTTKP
jgi:hypothetical protein